MDRLQVARLGLNPMSPDPASSLLFSTNRMSLPEAMPGTEFIPAQFTLQVLPETQGSKSLLGGIGSGQLR